MPVGDFAGARRALVATTADDGSTVYQEQVVSASGSGAGANQVQGNTASGTTDAGNPVKVGGVTPPGTGNITPTTGNSERRDFLVDRYGNQRTVLVTYNLTPNTGSVQLAGYTINAARGGDAPTNAVPLAVLDGWWTGTTIVAAMGQNDGGYVRTAPGTVSTALSGTIATSGGTAALTMTNTTKSEIINASTGTLWASWGTPAVNGAGSFPILTGGTYPIDRVAGTLTLLSTAANQTYTVNRFSY